MATPRGCRGQGLILRFIFLEINSMVLFSGQGEAALTKTRGSALTPHRCCSPSLHCSPTGQLTTPHTLHTPTTGPCIACIICLQYCASHPLPLHIHVSSLLGHCLKVTFSVRPSLTVFSIASLPAIFAIYIAHLLT